MFSAAWKVSIGATAPTVVLVIRPVQALDAEPVLFTQAARMLPSVSSMLVGSTMPGSALVGVAYTDEYETRLFAG